MQPIYTFRSTLVLDAGYRAPFVFSALGDVNGDGHADLLVLGQQYPGTPGVNATNWQAQPGRLFLGDGIGGFTAAPTALFPVDGLRTVHAREVIFADFNGDGRNDVFVADHGWDAPPFPGQNNLLFLSTPEGGWRDASASLPQVNDFTHSVAAADIDGDGDIDLFVGNGYNNSGNAASSAYMLLNDGSGHFTRNDTVVPVTVGQALHIYAPDGGINHFPGSTFSDLNGDGLPDLVITADAANTYDAFRQSTVFWNVGGRFESTRTTKLPEVVGTPSHIDMDAAFADFDGDGLKDIVLVGTNGQPFYDGAFVQILRNLGAEQFEDVSTAVLPSSVRNLTQSGVNTGNPWPIWVRTGDFNGDTAPDFLIEYSGRLQDSTPVLWLNDGTGRFSVVTASTFRPDREHWQVDFGQWLVTPQGLQIVTPQIYEGSGGLLLTGRSTASPWFGRPNDPGDETIVGSAGNDRLVGGLGNDNIDGGFGLDSATFQLQRAQYTVSKSAQGNYSVTALSGNEGIDTLRNIERLVFSDMRLALDLEGNAGQVVKILGAVFGPAAVANMSYAGIGLGYLDSGMSYLDLMQLAIDARTGGRASSTDLVNLLYTNIVGTAPSPADRDFYGGLLDSGSYTPASLGVLAAETSLNASNIDLVGLSQTGLAYLPV